MPDFVLTSMTLKAALTPLILMAAAYSYISEKLAPIAISIAAMLALWMIPKFWPMTAP
jgi:hypothetical protein